MDSSLLDTKWIWHPDWTDHAPHSAGGIVHFRKELNLESVPSDPLMIQLTADTKYQLYINSKLVHIGPVKGDDHMWFYDDINVQPFLNTGMNQISIRVLRFYYATSYATSFPRLPIPGLFVRTPDVQLREIHGIQSDESWDCAVDPTTLLRTDQAEDDFLHVYEDVDAHRGCHLRWEPAKVLQLSTTHGLAPPWILSPRMIPVASSSPARFNAVNNVRSSLSSDEWETVVLFPSEDATPICLPAGSSHHIELQAEHHLTARLAFRFRRPSKGGSVLRVTYSECYEDEPEYVPYIRKKADRTDITKKLYGPQDKYVFAGGAGKETALDLAYIEGAASVEVFSPFHLRTLRFISIDIDVCPDDDLVMEGLELTETKYPLEVLGTFHIPPSISTASTYHDMWNISVRTLNNCMHDCYEDCPFYEQLQYAMDVRSSCLFTYAISGDDRMARQAITQLHNSYRPELGLIASRSPAHQLQIIPHFSLFWICTVADHFEHFADVPFTRRFLSTCDAILETFARRIDTRLGLVASGAKELGTHWDFVDWAPEWKPMGIPPQQTGYQTFTSLIYAYTLQSLARVVDLAGRPALAADYMARSGNVIDAVRKHCWDGSVFTDGLAITADYAQDISEHIQIWATLVGAVQGDEARALLTRSLTQSGSSTLSQSREHLSFTKVSTAMSIYTLQAMSQVGGTLYDDSFHAFWNPWRHQLSQNMTTWCEDNVTLRSDCHAWSSVPLYEFMTEVAGVTPAIPGWKSIAIKPRIALFEEFDARVPLGGMLKPGVACVSWKRTAEEDCVLVTVTLEACPLENVEMHIKFPDGHVELHVGQEASVKFSRRLVTIA
ncbi:Six-hairpin glycosidase-like protein [Paraphoma chrysanthemicola]|nr:Six-hairpin glycosidase-like protein [Paraphoma chrysanthemicola]